MEKPEYFECQCSSAGHILRFTYDDEENEIYTEVLLIPCGFFMRVWKSIKYILNIEVPYGFWDCTMIRNKDVPRLISLLEKVNKPCQRKSS